MADDRELAEWLDVYLARKYGRLLNRFFRGTVHEVKGVSGNYRVALIRLGETLPDGNLYQVAPTYSGTPMAGDKVECMWRDDATAYVLFKAPN